jgi:hypothetical protein
MPLPKAFVDSSYRTEPVDLQPFGNTVSIETGSDNPFEDDQDVEIFSQQSGGMAGPDPRMRSKKTLIKGTKVTTHQAGVARTYKTRSQANRQGFMPGMAGFAGLGADPAPGLDQDEGNPPGYVPPAGQAAPASPAAPAAPPTGAWAALTSLFSAGPAGVTAYETAKSNAPKPPGMPPAGMPPAPGKSTSITKMLPWILGGVGVLVVGGLLAGRSKPATVVATNPRRRRHRR